MNKNLKIILGGVLIIIAIFSIASLLQPKTIKRDSKIEEINYSEDKINIYVFWGNGCPHCEKLFQFLESEQRNYSKYYNIYAFEVWENKENEELMNRFANKLNDKLNGVPYFIIGDKSFKGFTEENKEEILKTIKEKYENRSSIESFKDVITNQTTNE